MKLVFPTIAYKLKAIDFIDEFYEYSSAINGSGSLDRFLKESTYEAWLDKIAADIDIANVQPPRVPALTYFFVREEDEKIIGMVNLRLALNDFIKNEAGHIGYCIRPTERGRHYASEMLMLALKVYDCIGISDIILTCDKDNPASAKTIISCGGKLDDEFYSEVFGEVIQRYIISRNE